MNRSIRHGGENEMNNNANIGEAYRKFLGYGLKHQINVVEEVGLGGCQELGK
jgi:hypothetical protein